MTADYQHSLSFSVVEKTADTARAEMETSSDMLNPFGTVHAGALIWFADVTATHCALGDTVVAEDGKGFPLAIDLHTVLAGNVPAGHKIYATSHTKKRGRKLVVVHTDVKSEEGKLLIQLTSTHMIA